MHTPPFSSVAFVMRAKLFIQQYHLEEEKTTTHYRNKLFPPPDGCDVISGVRRKSVRSSLPLPPKP